ncbi:hypothetical protein HDK77DRAFT_430407 [Phyllosticta capitalensis]
MANDADEPSSSQDQQQAHGATADAVFHGRQQQIPVDENSSAASGAEQDAAHESATTQQPLSFDSRVQELNNQSQQLSTALQTLALSLNQALSASITDADLASVGFEAHDLPDGLRVYFYNVDQRGDGSGADASFGGPFTRAEAVDEYRARMGYRWG